jgi:hypothetical protein
MLKYNIKCHKLFPLLLKEAVSGTNIRAYGEEDITYIKELASSRYLYCELYENCISNPPYRKSFLYITVTNSKRSSTDLYYHIFLYPLLSLPYILSKAKISFNGFLNIILCLKLWCLHPVSCIRSGSGVSV